MRQPNSQRHSRDREHGYLPKSGGSSARGGGSHSQQDPPELIVTNGRGNDSSGDSVGSSGHRGRQSPHGLEMETKASRLGQAANPNRAEMPGSGRRTSYDPNVRIISEVRPPSKYDAAVTWSQIRWSPQYCVICVCVVHYVCKSLSVALS